MGLAKRPRKEIYVRGSHFVKYFEKEAFGEECVLSQDSKTKEWELLIYTDLDDAWEMELHPHGGKHYDTLNLEGLFNLGEIPWQTPDRSIIKTTVNVNIRYAEQSPDRRRLSEDPCAAHRRVLKELRGPPF